MKIRYILLVAILLGTAGMARAQTVQPKQFKDNLAAPDPFTHSRVTVQENGELSATLNRTQTIDGKMVEGYRVYIFLDNKQDSRQKAQEAISTFRNAYPDIPVDRPIYDTPFWKVAVGNCLSKEEAMIVFGRVKGAFPGAFVRKENLPLKSFLDKPVVVTIPDTTEATE